MTVVSRPYRDDGDRLLIHDLLRQATGTEPAPVICFIGDFEWWQVNDDDPEALRSARLWFTGDRLVAFSWPSGRSLDVVTHPERRVLEAAILDDWVAGQADRDVTLSVNALDSDAPRIAALKACGFVPVARAYNVWAQTLDDLPPCLPPPDGYTVRSFAGEKEIASRVAAHRSAFHPSRMTIEKHRRAMASPLYRQDLDIVAVGPDGQVASYALVWFDDVNRKGLFEPVGTHADHRRRGLSRCVIQEGLRRLRALGATLAYVNSNVDDVASNALYAACGFEIADGEARWERPGEAATTPAA
jgi:ribosomal protein S18 acetylase RimI-like enzyme